VNALVVAVLGGVIGALGPVLLIRANGRERRKDQRLTWERDDAVAAQAAEAARLLLAAQRESIARTDEVAQHVADSTTRTTAKLDIIHTLVNSTLTAALQAQLDASRRELVMMLELADMQKAAGETVSAQRLASIAALRRKVGELSAQMQEREVQTRTAETQIATEAARQAGRPAP
jgi:hypothetical protein